VSFILTSNNSCIAIECNFVINETNGRINTTGYPNSFYAPNSNCTWIIDLPADQYKRIELKFDEISIENSSDCAKDRVTILNGKEKDSLSLGSYCGNQLPTTIYSSTEAITIKFISDGSVNNKGFSLQYRGIKERSKGTHKYSKGINIYIQSFICRSVWMQQIYK